MAGFVLHPQLQADTAFVADWPLSRLLAMNDARYPWLILVPRKEHAVEIFDLDEADRQALIGEVSRAAEQLKHLTGAAKINIGALGNIVPQLHVHIVARRPGDEAWPGPVWGKGQAVLYDAAALQAFLSGFVSSP
jgi:diadenosine tetraphosphate (Ap4A) HIT family hydrolase